MDFSSERMARNVRQVSHLDIAGGGQIFVEGATAYVGHMKAAEGTTIIDVADPARPAVLGNIPTSRLSHAHKVRVVGNLMVVNVETAERDVDRPYSEGGIRIFDVSRPAAPVELGFFGVTGIGIHRFDFDGTYAYLSSSMDGYLHNIVRDRGPLRSAEAARGARAGGCRANGWRAARRPSRAGGSAATIRCASATGSMSAI